MTVTLRDLQDDIIDGSKALPDILRRAMVFAYHLNVPEFKSWVDRELDGYVGKDVDLPNYRSFPGTSYGNFWCIGGTYIKHAPIPTFGLDEMVQEFSDTIELRQGVSAFEDMTFNDNLSVQLPWPPDLVAYVGEIGAVRPGCALQSAYQVVSKSQIDNILDTIKNRLLTYILELEDQFPEMAQSENPENSADSQEASALFQQVVIHGGQNVLGTGNIVAQISIPNIETGNFEELANYLGEINGVTTEDVEDLRVALEEDAQEGTRGIGARARAWLGSLATKSASEAIGNAGGQSLMLATRAIAQYCGVDIGM